MKQIYQEGIHFYESPEKRVLLTAQHIGSRQVTLDTLESCLKGDVPDRADSFTASPAREGYRLDFYTTNALPSRVVLIEFRSPC